MSWLIPIIGTIILSFSDAFWYGYCHEKKKWFKSWLFKTYAFQGQELVPFYRILQWSLDVIVLYLSYTHCGWLPTICMILSWYFMNKEMNYYLVLGQWHNLVRYEREGIHVYWLDRLYFSGSFFFVERFTVRNFVISYIISWVCLALSVLSNDSIIHKLILLMY